MTKDRIRFTAVLAVAAVAALAVWLVISARQSPVGQQQAHNPAPGSNAATSRAHTTAATILPLGALRRAVRRVGSPVYWLGTRPNLKYEFTALAGGRTYVRYLPPGAHAGDPRRFLTVGTYVVASPLADLRRAGRARGATTTHLPGGGLAVMRRSAPMSAFIVRPGWNAEVEVFDPRPGMALTLILRGAVRPVR